MRMWMTLAGLMLLALWGCTAGYTPLESATDVVTLDVPFQESFTDTEGAKRVVICQFSDKRVESRFVGETRDGQKRVFRKFVAREDMTLVLPRVLGGYLKDVGFNVAFAGTPSGVGGGGIRDIVKRYDADYVLAGELEEFYVHSSLDAGGPAWAVMGLRLDVFNDVGQIRLTYPGHETQAGFLAEKATDPAEAAALMNRAMVGFFDAVLTNELFVRALELNPDTVRELLESRPAPVEVEDETPETGEIMLPPILPEEQPGPEMPETEEMAPPVLPELEMPEAPISEEDLMREKRMEEARKLDEAVEEP